MSVSQAVASCKDWTPKRSGASDVFRAVDLALGRKFAALAKALWWTGRDVERDAAGRPVVVGFFKSDRVGREIGRTDRTVRAWIRELVRAGFLILKRIPRGFRFVLSPVPQTPEPGLFDVTSSPDATGTDAGSSDPGAERTRGAGSSGNCAGSGESGTTGGGGGGGGSRFFSARARDRKVRSVSCTNHEPRKIQPGGTTTATTDREPGRVGDTNGSAGYDVRDRVIDWRDRVLATVPDTPIDRARLLIRWGISVPVAQEIANKDGCTVRGIVETVSGVLISRSPVFSRVGVMVWRLRKSVGLPVSELAGRVSGIYSRLPENDRAVLERLRTVQRFGRGTGSRR